MGSDLYQVNVPVYREHQSAAEAKKALSAYAHPPSMASFFDGEGPWIEIQFDVRSIHPDAPIGYDPLFIIRWLDEAVYGSARGDSAEYTYGNTPLSKRYPGLWSMGMNIDDEASSVVLVASVELRKNPSPREGNPKDPYGDTGAIAAFVHKKYAPNIADHGYWESRAWGGGGYFWRDYPKTRRPLLAEVRTLRSSVSLPCEKYNEYTSLAPRAEGGVWAANSLEVSKVEADGRPAVAFNILTDHKLAGISHLASLPDGTLWLATQKAVICRAPDGKAKVFKGGAELSTKKILSLATGHNGEVYVGADNGLYILGENDAWTHVADGLSERSVRRITPLSGGAMWVIGSSKPTRRNADGSLERFLSRQGVDSAYHMVELPKGAVWSCAYSTVPGYIAAGAGRAIADEGAAQVAREGLRLGVLAVDGTVWCIAFGGFLVRLREGDVPKVYVWDEGDPGLWTVSSLVVSKEGDLWLLLGDGSIRCVRASDIVAADAGPPLNKNALNFNKIAPFHFGPAPEKKEAAAQTIDFQGKVVAITGTLSKLTREEAQRVLSARGALLTDSVNKKTHYLIVGLRPSSKLQKAKSLGITILDEDVLLDAGGTPAAS